MERVEGEEGSINVEDEEPPGEIDFFWVRVKTCKSKSSLTKTQESRQVFIAGH